MSAINSTRLSQEGEGLAGRGGTPSLAFHITFDFEIYENNSYSLI